MLKRFLAAACLAILIGISAHVSAKTGIEEMLEKWMTCEFPENNSRWEVWDLSDKNTIDFTRYHVKEIVGVKKPKKIIVFRLETLGVHTKNTLEIKARVVRFVKVPVANKVIRKGVTIEKDDWFLEEKNSEIVQKDTVLDSKELNVKRTKKALAPGEIITLHAIEKIPDVISGKKVMLKVIGDGVVLSTDAISLQEGNVDDWIKLKQEPSEKIVKAQIMGPHLAQIVLTSRSEP